VRGEETSPGFDQKFENMIKEPEADVSGSFILKYSDENGEW
jgi:hypothetical protein